jgi:hypothetical protein
VYSPKIISQTLAMFAAKNGWEPQPHSVSEVLEMNEYINSLISIETNERASYYDLKPGMHLTEKRRQYIQRWITNERFMCFADAQYFKTRYAWLVNEKSDVFKYEPRQSQLIFHKILAWFDENQFPIEIFVVKGRQVGISTEVSLDFDHRLLFMPNTQAVMASVQAEKSELLARIQETCYNRLPFWLAPRKTVLKTRTPQWENGSILSIQSGSQATGIAQGWTPVLCHISELADIVNPEKVLEEGLFRAIHSTRKTFFVIEGTGSSDDSWQAEKWRFYKENWGKGGRFCPLFIPPACASDLYPEKDWLRAHPIPVGWSPMDETKRMQRRGELYVRSTDALSRVMGASWKMSREYLWFWETNYKEAVASHTEKIFLQQMACTDTEALQGKHDKVFTDETIEIVNREKERNYDAFAVTGKSILIGSGNEPYQPDPDEIDYTKERITVLWTSPDDHFYEWELVPLKAFDDSSDEACMNKLLVFHYPKMNVDYSIGVDTADGLGMPNEDRSCLSTAINRTGSERDEQVCEFSSVNVNSAQMSRIAACVAAWYGENTKNPLGCKFAIEQIRKPGDECQHQLKIMGFYNHHKFIFYDGKGQPDPNKATKEGWRTNKWSRSMMLDKFIDAINGGWMKPNSPVLIRQMKDLVRKETSGISTISHQSRKHDDAVFASAMSYFTAHDMEGTAARFEEKYKSFDDRTQKPDLRWAERSIIIM